jgi:hypothetical protein
MPERIIDMRTGRTMHREFLGSVLYGKLELERCTRSAGMWDLVWTGTDPKRAIDERLTGLIKMCWSLSTLRTGRSLPKPRPIALGDGSFWLARLAPGSYTVERDDNGGVALYEWHVPPPVRKQITGQHDRAL